MEEFTINFLLPFGIVLIFVMIGGGCVIGIVKVVEWYSKKPRVIQYGSYWIIYRRYLGGQYYERGQNYWWMTHVYADRYSTREAAIDNLPVRSLGPIAKIKRKAQYKKIKREQEERLKKHKDKMLKVRMDFSDYG